VTDEIPLMSDGRSSRYVVVKFGYLTRGESMNVAVLAWEHGVGPDTPVVQRVIVDWGHVMASFPRAGGDEMRDDVIKRLAGIQTFGDYEKVLGKMGPYTPFEFTEERGSIASPEDTLEHMAAFFLRPYGEEPQTQPRNNPFFTMLRDAQDLP
jgi:hypothetical protein